MMFIPIILYLLTSVIILIAMAFVWGMIWMTVD